MVVWLVFEVRLHQGVVVQCENSYKCQTGLLFSSSIVIKPLMNNNEGNCTGSLCLLVLVLSSYPPGMGTFLQVDLVELSYMYYHFFLLCVIHIFCSHTWSQLHIIDSFWISSFDRNRVSRTANLEIQSRSPVIKFGF
jgi:hypothetical protein